MDDASCWQLLREFLVEHPEAEYVLNENEDPVLRGDWAFEWHLWLAHRGVIDFDAALEANLKLQRLTREGRNQWQKA